MALEGLDSVLKNLGKEIKKIEGNSLKGLIRGAIIVIRDMESSSPKIPVDTGNLRASRFLVTSKGGAPVGRSPGFSGTDAGKASSQHSTVLSDKKTLISGKKEPFVTLGFTANYAWKVHEAVDVSFRRPSSGAKFLESSLSRNKQKILDVIREEARII